MCNVDECELDGGDCVHHSDRLKCAPSCHLDGSNGICNLECDVVECHKDWGDCEFPNLYECAMGCLKT